MDDHALTRLLREVRDAAAGGVADAELLARFAATGDAAAFELLVRRHGRLVFGVCRRVLRDHHDAEDAFQATFLALARKAGGIGKREAVAGWLFRVARRAALAARADRARRTARERPAPAVEAVPAPDDPAAAPERREAWAAVDEEVGRLPERFRAAAVLCYLEGKTVDEAARLLGCPRGTVASRLARARARLHKRLSRRGVGLAVGIGAPAEGLIRPTVRAAVLYASGKAAGQGVSLAAISLAKKVVRAMFLKKLTTGAALATLAGALLLGGGLTVWLHAKASAAPTATPTAVTVSRPVRREFTPSEDFTGRLREAYVPVMARVSGRLAQAHSDLDFVKKGDVLFEVDPAPLKATLTRAEAMLKVAEAGAARAAAAAAVKRARQDLEAARIVAPMDGHVHQITAGKGDEIAGAWERPVQLAGLDPHDAAGIRFEIDERTFLRYQRLLVAREIKGEGDPLFVGLPDEPGFPHEGMITSLEDHFDPDKGVIGVYGVFPDPDHLFLPGMFARVRLPLGKPAPAVEAAEDAVFTDQGVKYVWVVGAGNVVERRDIQAGQRDGDLIVVKEGLSPDDWVVVAGGKGLHAGDKVEPCRTAMPGSRTEPRP